MHRHTSSVTTPGDGRGRILGAAIALFAKRGLDGVSISDVALEAHVVKSAIYYHFPSKEALYRAVIEESTRSSREAMEAAAVGASWLDRLRGAACALGRLFGPRSHVFSLILEGLAQSSADASPARLAIVSGLRREFTSVLAREIAAGIAAGDLRPIDPVMGGLCLVGLVAAALQSSPDSYDERLVDYAVDLFLNGAIHRDGMPEGSLAT